MRYELTILVAVRLRPLSRIIFKYETDNQFQRKGAQGVQGACQQGAQVTQQLPPNHQGQLEGC